jgi:hypothetical protein
VGILAIFSLLRRACRLLEVITVDDAKREIRGLLLAAGASRSRVYIACDVNKTLIGVKSPYNHTYVENLKYTIPGTEREWDAGSRTWWFNSTYYNPIIQLLIQVYGENNIVKCGDVERCAALIPTRRPRRYKDKDNLNKTLIEAIQKVSNEVKETDDTIISDPIVDVVEIIMDYWKEGLITDKDALENIYSLINKIK